MRGKACKKWHPACSGRWYSPFQDSVLVVFEGGHILAQPARKIERKMKRIVLQILIFGERPQPLAWEIGIPKAAISVGNCSLTRRLGLAQWRTQDLSLLFS